MYVCIPIPYITAKFIYIQYFHFHARNSIANQQPLCPRTEVNEKHGAEEEIQSKPCQQ